ncbi:MAG: TIGR00730 family Rossman fold protein [Actinobacteria bacterium]|nr:TIGR00730 family Rossman fold protein [Actinomycetota bacterium]
MKSVCVFCGSSPGNDPAYLAAARATGTELARRGLTLVYGAGSVGLMGAVADAALAAGGSVVGVIPEHLMGVEVDHRGLTELHVVESMHARKALMAQRSDAFVALPGGFGTIEEVVEILTWSQLGLHRKGVGFLDVAGYYTPLLRFFQQAVAAGFVREANLTLYEADSEIGPLLDALARWEPVTTTKWAQRT